jgi:predicted secreted protein
MPLPLSLAVFFTIWWVALFAVLPIGVKSQTEAGVVDAPVGSDPGAPAAHNLPKKALWTTLIAILVFAALDAFVYATS